MSKKKIILIICGSVFLIITVFTLFTLWLNDAFKKLLITDVASFTSPDKKYTISYQQIGDPEFPFGKTNVRLTVYDSDHHKVNSVDTFIQDDGCIAAPGNVYSVVWMEHSVLVVLQASEMENKTVIVPLTD